MSAEVARITGDGKLGIGTHTPSGKFDVRGDVYFGNDIYLTDESGGYEKVEVGLNDIRVESKHIHSEFGVWTRSTSIGDRKNGIEGDGDEEINATNHRFQVYEKKSVKTAKNVQAIALFFTSIESIRNER